MPDPTAVVLGVFLAVMTGSGFGQTGPSGGPAGSVDPMTQILIDLHARYQKGNSAEQARLLSELVTVAAERQRHLSALIETHPGEVLRLAMPADIRARMPSQVQGFIEEWVEIEGEVELLVEDRESDARYLYFLQTKKERLSLHFASEPPTNLLTGSRIRVKGIRLGKDIVL